MMMAEIVVIVYTTQYRLGGDKFKKVAETLEKEKSALFSEVLCKATETKQTIKDLFQSITNSGKTIKEFHFIGHAGMYGPMFGSVKFPEQFSPYELNLLEIPFSSDGSAYFHCCRSARWFAPYFAKIHGVTTYGYHWYTTFSTSKNLYRRVYFWSDTRSLYCFGCPGRKSHGIAATGKKILGLMQPESMKQFNPEKTDDRSYYEVADLYAKTFQDITVRADEYQFIRKHLPSQPKKVLDIGCGNGALLKALSPDIGEGVGVDVTENLLEHARSLKVHNLSFHKIDGPKLPFDVDSFDVVISLLSFRYLDWDPIMDEIQRILKHEGKLIIVDMVTAPLKIKEWPKFLKSKIRHYFSRYHYPKFYHNLQQLVSHPDWKKMLKHNPIRSQHEMKWYLESRFPNRKVEVINVGMHSRILAFQSGDMSDVKTIKLTYP